MLGFGYVCVWLSFALWIDKYACLGIKIPCCMLDALLVCVCVCVCVRARVCEFRIKVLN